MVDLLNSQHNNDNDNSPFNVFSHALSSSGTSTDPKLSKKKERNHLMCTICGYVDLNCVEISRIHLVSFADL